MWRFQQKRRLDYPTIEAWLKSEGLTTSIVQIADPLERDRRITEYAELRRKLFAKHAKTLSVDEQRQLADSCHPSQSHRLADRAEPSVGLLYEYLESLGLEASVSLYYDHADRIVLLAELSEKFQQRRSELPWLFHGFEIMYRWTTAEEDPR